MAALSHAKMKLFGILAAALILCVLPATAFAAQVNIYTDDAAGTSTLIAAVDTDNITGTDFSGQYLKKGVWNVVQGSNCMTLDGFLTTYAPSQWASAASVTFDTVDYPNGYKKYNNGVFTKAELRATGYFYGSTMHNSALPLPGTGTDVGPAVLTLKWGKQAQGVGESAGYVANGITPTDHTYPRLISGFAGSSPTAVGGNRFPAQITAIHLHN